MTDRALLDVIAEQPVSGVALSKKLGIGRSAVWKRIEQLRAAGFDIETQAGQGYFLKHPVQWLDEEKIISSLNAEAKTLLGSVHIREQVDSTNAWAQIEKKTQSGLRYFFGRATNRRSRSAWPCLGVADGSQYLSKYSAWF